MVIPKTLSLGLLATALTGLSHANPLLNYTYIEAGGSRQTIDERVGDTRIDHRYIEGSLRTGNLVFQAGYSQGEYDELAGINLSSGDIDERDISLLIGGIRDFSEHTSLLVGVGYTDHETDADIINVTIDAKVYRFRMQLRHLLSERLEANGELNYLHMDIEDEDTEDDTLLSLGLRYHFTHHASVGVEYTHSFEDSDNQSLSGNARWQF